MGSSRPPGAGMLHLTLTYETWGSLNQCLHDPRIYMSGGEDTFYMYIGAYVDDMILAGKDEAEMKRSYHQSLISKITES